MTKSDIIALMERACLKLCPRCAKRHAARRDAVAWLDGVWIHGPAMVGDELWGNSECPAGPVRDVIEAVKAGEKAR